MAKRRATKARRVQRWLLLLLLAAFPLACAPDAEPEAAEEPSEDARKVEVERRLNLALSNVEADAELRDEGTAEEASPQPASEAPGETGSTAGETSGDPEPEAEPDPERENETAPEPRPEPEGEPQPAPEPTVEDDATELAERPSQAEEEGVEARSSEEEAEAEESEEVEAEVAQADAEPASEGEAGDAGEGEEGEGEGEQRHTLPTGTRFQVEFNQQLNSEWSRPGDVFLASLATPLIDEEGRVIAETGTEVVGTVTEVRQPGESGRNGAIEVRFTQVVIDGQSYPIDATAETETRLETVGDTREGPSRGDGATRGAITGAILGGIFGGSGRSAAIGAGVGAAAGAARAGGGDGQIASVVLTSGTRVSCETNSPFVGPPIRADRR